MLAEPGETLTDAFSDRGGDDLAGDLTDDLRARVKGELEPGERLIWATASPAPPLENEVNSYAVAGVLALSSLVVGVVFIVLGTQDPRAHVERRYPVELGMIFCAIACLTMIGTVAIWYFRRDKPRRPVTIYYAVTDRRAIQWQPEPGSDAVRVVCFRPGEIHQLVRIQHPDGSGNLELYQRVGRGRDGGWITGPKGFQNIPDVRRVEQIIRNNLMNVEETG